MIAYAKFVQDFLKSNNLTEKELHDMKVDDVYKDFVKSLPNGLSITKRMFLKHIRILLPVDTQAGYEYVETGTYKTVTKFKEILRAKTLEELGFQEFHTEDFYRYQIPNRIQLQIDKRTGDCSIQTRGFDLNKELTAAILRCQVNIEAERNKRLAKTEASDEQES